MSEAWGTVWPLLIGAGIALVSTLLTRLVDYYIQNKQSRKTKIDKAYNLFGQITSRSGFISSLEDGAPDEGFMQNTMSQIDDALKDLLEDDASSEDWEMYIGILEDILDNMKQ